MPNDDMLAFTYRLGGIIRDMRHADMPDAEEETKRDLIIAVLQDVCERIEREFS